MTQEKRGYSLGKALLTESIEKAKSIDGIENVYLTVGSTNRSAKKLSALLGL
ncbi:GNAT family N-acetyltransferase [Bacillus sp. HSf4]|uniref:GNAT family N-acetyltransferase n=1 Tax=Bacillus sp. HSf4 TaxID=3035514 RepID=UPI002408F4E5|nr:GNAT family N-acetyltransferase [Bacillus sp. HSf4]WFA06707.1 GNAT family N-acetyltransferase [Bacillus sp. HSf4]